MFRRLLSACCFVPTIALAQPPFVPDDPELVLIESYIHYFMAKEIFHECAKVVPQQSKIFSEAFAAWEERNKDQISFVNNVFSVYFASRPKDAKELSDAAPSIAHEQYVSSPYDAALCTNMLLATNTMGIMDYSFRLKDHLEILRKHYGDS